MNENPLGKLIEGEVSRDAIHVAICPVIAGERLHPGQRVKFKDDKVVGTKMSAIGIVDPFLITFIEPNQQIWMLLMPGTITSLKHVWEHPAFGKNLPSGEEVFDKKEEEHRAEKKLREFADRINISYQQLLKAASEYVATGDYLIDGGKFEGVRMPDDFWDNYEIITKTKIDMIDRGYFFSCSCT